MRLTQHTDPEACHWGRCIQYGGLELVQKERCTDKSHSRFLSMLVVRMRSERAIVCMHV